MVRGSAHKALRRSREGEGVLRAQTRWAHLIFCLWVRVASLEAGGHEIDKPLQPHEREQAAGVGRTGAEAGLTGLARALERSGAVPGRHTSRGPRGQRAKVSERPRVSGLRPPESVDRSASRIFDWVVYKLF